MLSGLQNLLVQKGYQNHSVPAECGTVTEDKQVRPEDLK